MVPPLTGLAVKVTLLPLHTVVVAVLILTDGTMDGVTVIKSALLLAVELFTQAALLVNSQVTTSLLLSSDVVKEVLLVPALFPFIFHWYTGALPPLTGVAVNVTACEAHIVVDAVAIVTVGLTDGNTVTVTRLEVAGLLVAHAALLVTTQLITSLLVAGLSI